MLRGFTTRDMGLNLFKFRWRSAKFLPKSLSVYAIPCQDHTRTGTGGRTSSLNVKERANVVAFKRPSACQSFPPARQPTTTHLHVSRDCGAPLPAENRDGRGRGEGVRDCDGICCPDVVMKQYHGRQGSLTIIDVVPATNNSSLPILFSSTNWLLTCFCIMLARCAAT